ncbi:MAG: M48 family metalloprotease [Pseudomonadota bacterium]
MAIHHAHQHRRTGKRSAWSAVMCATALFAALSSCTTNPATGRREFTPFMSQNQEAQIGAQEHPKLLEQFGGAYTAPKTTEYVEDVGNRLAAQSELPNLGFTFTTLNSKVINAFALPGGYVYMSRGLLGLMNDEAELASVLGHEIGHVTARHSANRYNKSIFAQIASVGIGMATGSGDLANLVSQTSQMYLLSYSRNQELEADELGVRYMARLGYDPFGAPRMLTTLGAATSLDQRILGKAEAAQIPAWARTHPLTSERVSVALQEAREASAALPAAQRGRGSLLNALDGMRWDDDPDQGIIDGRAFRHGQLGFGFVVPPGFALENGETAVRANGPNGAVMIFTGGRAERPVADQAQQIWRSLTQNQAGALQNVQALTVKNMPAATGNARLSSNGAQLDFRVVAIDFGNGSAYSFVFVSPANMTANLNPEFQQTLYSFKKLTSAQKANVRGRRIKVITVEPRDTLQSLAKTMAYQDYKLDRFLVLNGLDKNAKLKAGDRLKTVVNG